MIVISSILILFPKLELGKQCKSGKQRKVLYDLSSLHHGRPILKVNREKRL